MHWWRRKRVHCEHLSHIRRNHMALYPSWSPCRSRPRWSFEFYQQALGVDAVGEQADDGVPEPLQFPLNDGVRLMLIPRGGFGWVVQPRTVAEEGHRECLVTVFADDDTG